MKNGISAPFRAFKKFILKKPIKNDGIFIKPIKSDYQKFVSGLESAEKPLFNPQEINYLKNAKLFDWEFKKPVQAIIMALKGRSGD